MKFELKLSITIAHLIPNFSSTRVSYRYHLAHRTYTKELDQQETVYVSLPEAHTIIQIKSIEDPLPIER